MMRSTRPGAGDKYFIRKASGGFSTCIAGSPKDPACDVLANCVGYACGAFNETVDAGKEVYNLNCNAENFIERAISLGLSISKDPVVGGIMVYQKGATLSGSDGAGHVAYVYAKLDNDTVKTSESGYGCNVFWTTTRKRGSGNWGAGANYTYRGCIVNPNVKEEPKPVEPPFPYEGVSDEELARRVWTGEFGNAEARATALGIRYASVQALVNAGVGKPIPVPTGFRKGEQVIPTRLISYTGARLAQYDKQYTVYEDSRNDRVVLAAPRHGVLVVWAAMNIKDVRRV